MLLTKTTADNTDIVKAGSILILHKDGLLLCSVDAKAPLTSTYKNGDISFGFGAKLAWGGALGRAHEEKPASQIPKRKFAVGEKFWITSYDVQSDGVVLKFYSDPYDNIRYYGHGSPFVPESPASDSYWLGFGARIVNDDVEWYVPDASQTSRSEIFRWRA